MRRQREDGAWLYGVYSPEEPFDAVLLRLLEGAVESPEEVLRKLHLIREHTLINAAIVAFAKQVMPDFPQCGLRMARFRASPIPIGCSLSTSRIRSISSTGSP